MAILSGRQAEEWLKNNPKAAYNVMNESGGVQKMVDADRGLLGNILGSITKPFSNLGRGMAELYNSATSENKRPLFMSQEEVDNPLEYGIKNAAGAASFFVPVGGAASIAGAAGRGALAGGLASFGAQDMGKLDLTDIGKGALMGGAFSGSLRGLSNLRGGKNPLQQVDDAIMQQQDDFVKQGLSQAEITKRLGTGAGQTNARLNYITQNFGDDVADDVGRATTYKNTLQSLLDDLSPDDAYRPSVERYLQQADDNLMKLTQSGADNVAPKGIFGKIGKKLTDKGDELETTGLRRSVGGVAPKKLGGAQLEKQVMQYAKKNNIPVNNIDDLQGIADDIFQKSSGKIQNYADDLTSRGVNVTNKTQGLIDDLDDIVVKTKSSQMRKSMQRALDNIKDDIKVTKTPSDLYALKQNYGELAKFSPTANMAEKSTAGLYRQAYTKLNNALDDVFKANKINNFRSLNKDLSFATKVQDWVANNMSKNRGTAAVNDMAQDTAFGTAILTGNPLTAIPGYVGGKVLQSPRADKVTGKLLQGIGDRMQGVGNKIPSVPGGQLLKSAAQKASPVASQPAVQKAGALLPAMTQAPSRGDFEGGPEIRDTLSFEEFQQQYRQAQGIDPNQAEKNQMLSDLMMAGADMDTAQKIVDSRYPPATEKDAADITAERNAQEAIGLIDEILGRDTKNITGLFRFGNILDPTGTATTKAKVDQLKSLLALAARGQLKGQGTITDTETKMLQDAQAALNYSMSDDDFKAELNKIRGTIASTLGN